MSCLRSLVAPVVLVLRERRAGGSQSVCGARRRRTHVSTVMATCRDRDLSEPAGRDARNGGSPMPPATASRTARARESQARRSGSELRTERDEREHDLRRSTDTQIYIRDACMEG